MSKKKSRKPARRDPNHQGRVTVPKSARTAEMLAAGAGTDALPAPRTAGKGAKSGNRAIRRDAAGEAAISQLAVAEENLAEIEGGKAKRRAILGAAVAAVAAAGGLASILLDAVGPIAAVAALVVGFGAAAAAFIGKGAFGGLTKWARWVAAGVGAAGTVLDLAVFGSIVGSVFAFAGGVVGWLAATVGADQFKPVAPIGGSDKARLEMLGATVAEDPSTGMTIASVGGRVAAVTRVELDGADPRTHPEVMAFASKISQYRRLLPAGLSDAGVRFGGVCIASGVDRVVDVGDGVVCAGTSQLGRALERATS